MNSPLSISVVALAGVFGFTFTTTAIEYADVDPRSLALEVLQYNDDGTVTQKISGGLPADWAAQITRNVGGVDEVLCSGRGRGPIYDGSEVTYSTSDWTFDDCPPLVSGDIGISSWEYVNENGTPVTISGRFVVGEDT